MKKYICTVLAISFLQVPKIVFAQDETMIPTATVVDQLSRAEAETKVRDIVNSNDIRAKLASYGITPQDVSGRLASLSDNELRELSSQMEQARYGGEALVAVLVIVVLVLLVIFLVKRI